MAEFHSENLGFGSNLGLGGAPLSMPQVPSDDSKPSVTASMELLLNNSPYQPGRS